VHELTAGRCSSAAKLALRPPDPVVGSLHAAERTLATMLELQPAHLGYLR
jgi:hypothetical protein